jgi:hypothetical protein
MKHLAAFLTVIAALAISASARAAEPAITSDPAKTIRSFYHWYVTVLISNQDPMKNRAEMKRFVTDRLRNEIEKMVKGPDGLDGDYFVDAQDFDNKWAKSISVSNVNIRGAKATADVLLTGSDTRMNKRLSLDLVNDGGTWKIDKVQGH